MHHALLLSLMAAACAGGHRTTLQQPVGRTHTSGPPSAFIEPRKPPPSAGPDPEAAHSQRAGAPQPTSLPMRGDDPVCDLPDTPAKSLLFASNDAALRERGTQILDDVLACMEYGLLAGKRLLVVGFSDPRGSAAHNYRLGLERARAVQRYLIRRGVPPDRISIASRGEQLARGDSPETWMFDRRVEIGVLR